MVLMMSLALNRRVSESVCLCYVDHDFALHKEFIGLYTVSETTDEGIAKVATDVLLRHNLPTVHHYNNILFDLDIVYTTHSM